MTYPNENRKPVADTLFPLEDFYPEIYKALDSQSLKAQELFFLQLKVQSLILILIPFFVTIIVLEPQDIIFSLVPAALLLVLLVGNIIWKPDDSNIKWQVYRSSAENIKRETWFYYMGCGAYTDTQNTMQNES